MHGCFLATDTKSMKDPCAYGLVETITSTFEMLIIVLIICHFFLLDAHTLHKKGRLKKGVGFTGYYKILKMRDIYI
jgi:hypothetical protein